MKGNIFDDICLMRLLDAFADASLIEIAIPNEMTAVFPILIAVSIPTVILILIPIMIAVIKTKEITNLVIVLMLMECVIIMI